VGRVDKLQDGDPGQIGPFKLVGRLGEGGMGRVYLGASPGGRRVAIKVVHPHYASDPEFRRRFAREVAAARQVGGFHTALVVDAGPDADLPWMATAYIPGPSLAEAIAQGGPLDETGVRKLGAALAEGLAAIHDCGLIHRDLKPSNVILADDGPRIIDFGIAKGEDFTSLTGSNAVIGTLRYMSPEQLQGQAQTQQSDIFALGSLLAYAATGRGPFDAPVIAAILYRIINDPPDLGPLVGDLREIIAGCLAKNPGDRPTPADLLARFTPLQPPGRAAEDETPELAPEQVVLPAQGVSVPGPVPPQSPTSGAPLPDITISIGVDAASSLGSRTLVPDSRQASTGHSAVPARGPQRRGNRRRTVMTVGGTVAVLAAATVGILLLDGHPGASSPLNSPPGTKSPVPSVTVTRPPVSLSATGSLEATLSDPHGIGVKSVAFGPDGTLATGNGNGNLAGTGTGYTHLWNTATKTITATLTDPGTNGIVSVAFGPGGTLAAGDFNGSTYLWNTATKTNIATLTHADGGVIHFIYSEAFGPDGILAVGEGNGTAHLWNTTTATFSTELTDPNSYLAESVVFGPGRILAIGDANGSTYLWNTATRTLTTTLSHPRSGWVYSVAFGPDGTLAAGGGDSDANGNNSTGYTYLWKIATKTIIATLHASHSSGVNSVAFGPDGILATGDANGNTYLWKINYQRS
jgi:serine/threonine protein kinase